MDTLEEFNHLPPDAQLLYLWEHCYYLAERLDEELVLIKMYQVETFFVEVRFRTPFHFEVVQAFRDAAFLQPYLDQIDLKALLR